MQGIFSRITENSFDQKAARQPAYLFGVLVKTSDVVTKVKSHWAYNSLWGRTPLSGALDRDAQIAGYSAVAPDHDRLESRKVRTYVDILAPEMYSNAGGKTVAAEDVTYVHMVTNNKSMPTGVSCYHYKNVSAVNSNTNTTKEAEEENKAVGVKPAAEGPDNVNSDVTSSGRDTPTQVSSKTAMGTNAATGTNLVPNTFLQSLTANFGWRF